MYFTSIKVSNCRFLYYRPQSSFVYKNTWYTLKIWIIKKIAVKELKDRNATFILRLY